MAVGRQGTGLAATALLSAAILGIGTTAARAAPLAGRGAVTAAARPRPLGSYERGPV